MNNTFQQFHEAALKLGECIRKGQDTETAWLEADLLGSKYSEHPLMGFLQCLSLYDQESMYGAYRENPTQQEVLDELKGSIFELAATIYDGQVAA